MERDVERRAKALTSLADIYRKMGEPARALPLIEEVLAITMENRSANHPDMAYALIEVAVVKDLAGDGGDDAVAAALDRTTRVLKTGKRMVSVLSLAKLVLLLQKRGKDLDLLLNRLDIISSI